MTKYVNLRDLLFGPSLTLEYAPSASNFGVENYLLTSTTRYDSSDFPSSDIYINLGRTKDVLGEIIEYLREDNYPSRDASRSTIRDLDLVVETLQQCKSTAKVAKLRNILIVKIGKAVAAASEVRKLSRLLEIKLFGDGNATQEEIVALIESVDLGLTDLRITIGQICDEFISLK